MSLVQFFMRLIDSSDHQRRGQALKGTTAGKKRLVKGGLLTTYCPLVK